MPSAASVKVEKQIAPESALGDSGNNSTPLRQAITIIEHKIRNLEKRKAKLESYKDLQNAGKELNADQKTAVAKFNEVLQTLDFARDLCKQFVGIATSTEKEAKKIAKKEAAAKNQAELARLREILLVQDALNQMGNEPVREDFLHGRNGAAQLNEADLKLLDDLYPAVTPKHEAGNPTAFTNEVQAAAEHLLAVVDGKPKEVFGGSYSQVKEILGKIHESGYFDQVPAQIEEYTAFTETQEVNVSDPGLMSVDAVPQPDQTQMLSPIENLAMESVTQMQQQQPQPPLEPTPVEQPLPPEQQQIYYQQPPRPITEVLGTGSFFFLQESELDTPPEQIPSQTFTNQSFTTTQPPPPIPLPHHFPNMPANMPQAIPPPNGNNCIEEHLKQPEEPQQKMTNHSPRPAPNNHNNYYQQNNGYNGRPRQRNGPRPNNSRHN